MKSRRPAPSIVANPVLVGAATVLVIVVGVFLAYNANKGLPFVPTYDVSVTVPDAAELTPGNDVRIGGKRVGVVDKVNAEQGANGKVYSTVKLKLEKSIQPIRSDTKVTIRPRSPLGIKYVQLDPGTRGAKVAQNGTLPARNTQPIVEIDEALDAFDSKTRQAVRNVIGDLSDGTASRGADLNDAITELNPLLTTLTPVMRNLRSSSTDLRGFIDGLAAGTSALAPVAGTANDFIDSLTTTLDAIQDQKPAVQQTLALAPDTERVGTEALGVARPVLADAASLARSLRPATALMPRATSDLADVVETGTPVLKRASTLGPDLQDTLDQLGSLSKQPATPNAIDGLKGVVSSLQPTLAFANPFQTQCNYLGLWARNVPPVVSEGDRNGNWFRFSLITQPSEMLQSAKPSPTLHNTPYGLATNQECEVGNEPYAPNTQVIGHAAGAQANTTQSTGIPAGVSSTP